MSNLVKMVIVMRDKYPDGKGGTITPRKGKLIAQGGHAATAFLLDAIKEGGAFSEHEETWFQTGMTKVCVRADSEEELLAIVEQAKAADITVHLVTDEGRTEFGGKPTNTCLALGPDLASKIDPISGHLKLL